MIVSFGRETIRVLLECVAHGRGKSSSGSHKAEKKQISLNSRYSTFLQMFIPLQAKRVGRQKKSTNKNLSVCLSVTNFDSNYLGTGQTEWAEIFLEHLPKTPYLNFFVLYLSIKGPVGPGPRAKKATDLSSNQNQKPIEKKVCRFGIQSCFCKRVFASKTNHELTLLWYQFMSPVSPIQ